MTIGLALRAEGDKSCDDDNDTDAEQGRDPAAPAFVHGLFRFSLMRLFVEKRMFSGHLVHDGDP